MEYYSAIKNKILPSAATWMDFQDMTLSKISQMDKDKHCVISLSVLVAQSCPTLCKPHGL